MLPKWSKKERRSLEHQIKPSDHPIWSYFGFPMAPGPKNSHFPAHFGPFLTRKNCKMLNISKASGILISTQLPAEPEMWPIHVPKRAAGFCLCSFRPFLCQNRFLQYFSNQRNAPCACMVTFFQLPAWSEKRPFFLAHFGPLWDVFGSENREMPNISSKVKQNFWRPIFKHLECPI